MNLRSCVRAVCPLNLQRTDRKKQQLTYYSGSEAEDTWSGTKQEKSLLELEVYSEGFVYK